jgi:hypothetical protein
MQSECLTSVNNLIKLFNIWSERSRFYPLFAVKPAHFPPALMETSDFNAIEAQSILGYLFELIDAPKCSQAVIDYVFGIIHNLVTYSNFEETEEDDRKIDRLPVQCDVDELEKNNTSLKGTF